MTSILLGGRLTGILLTLLSLIYIILGLVMPPNRSFPPLPLLEPESEMTGSLLIGQGFAKDAVHPSTDRSSVPINIKYAGSWLGSNNSTGNAQSPWYQTYGSFCLMVAGYPSFGKNSLNIQVKDPNGELSFIPLKGINPGGKWIMIKCISRNNKEPNKVRIIAKDGEIGDQGWIGVSQPFDDIQGLGSSLLSLLRIVLTVIISIVLIIGPGLALRAMVKSPNSLWRNFTLIAFPGIILLTINGLIVWLLAPVCRPQLITVILTLPALLWCLLMALRKSIHEIVSPIEWKALVIFMVVVIVAVAKATYSQGPIGELYGGTVSRTLEVGGRSDSRIAFHVVQLVAHGTKPYSEIGDSYFLPWSFSHRGPINGLAASPLVILSGANVPKSMPEQPWLPFDPEGFAVYRIFMSVMAATSLIVLFGLANALLNSRAGLFLIALASTSPFVLHEVYFTWPKLQATAFVLMAFYLVIIERVTWAGIILGIGYLMHPMALIYSPFIWVLYLIMEINKSPEAKLIFKVKSSVCDSKIRLKLMSDSIRIMLSMFFVILLWWIINIGHFKQTYFLSYFTMADGQPVDSVLVWVKERAISVANTIVPFYLFLLHGEHPSVNSIFGKSPNVIVFFQQYWNTLPFGLGLSCFGLLLVQLYRGARRFTYIFIIIVAMPFLLFSVYWGGAATGMMREGLHVWVFGILLFTTWSWVSAGKGKIRLANWQSALISLRAAEIVLLLLLPTLFTRKIVVQEQYYITDVVMLATMIIGVGWLGKRTYFITRTPI